MRTQNPFSHPFFCNTPLPPLSFSPLPCDFSNCVYPSPKESCKNLQKGVRIQCLLASSKKDLNLPPINHPLGKKIVELGHEKELPSPQIPFDPPRLHHHPYTEVRRGKCGEVGAKPFVSANDERRTTTIAKPQPPHLCVFPPNLLPERARAAGP